MENVNATIFKPSDIVTVILECTLLGCRGEVIGVFDDGNEDGPIEVQLGIGADSNYKFTFEPADLRHIRFLPSELKLGYEDDYETERGLNRLFGRMWHTSYRQSACSVICVHEKCERKASTTAWVNTWGTVFPVSVCSEHADYHGRCCDVFPGKKSGER